MKDDGQAPARPFWVDAALLVVTVLIAYFPAFWNGFVYDDEPYILANPLVQGPLKLKSIFTENYAPGRAEQGLYRPIVTLSYWVDHRVWNFAAPGSFNGFHLTNVLIHALNALLLFLLLRCWNVPRGACWFCALVFAIHPALSEAVTWIVGRAELLGTFFGLLAVYFYFRHPSRNGFLIAIFFWLLAMLSKEQWIALPVAIAILQTARPKRPVRREALIQLLIASILLFVFWSVRTLILGGWRPSLVTYQDVVTPLQRIWTSLELMWGYLWVWFFPVSLSVYHAIVPVESASRGLLSAGAWIFVFWAAWRARPYFPWAFWALGWFWALMISVSNLILPIGTSFGERFLYASTLFFAPLIVMTYQAFLRLAGKTGLSSLHGLFVGAPICIFLLIGLENRLPDWQSNLTLWESAARIYPHSFVIKAPLSESLLREGRFGEAHILAAESAQQLETQPLLYQKLFLPRLMRVDGAAQSGMRQIAWAKRFFIANETARSFQTSEALALYQKLADDFPEQPQTFEAIGSLYMRLENYEGARQNLQEAIRLGTKSAGVFAQYAYALSQLGHKAEAVLMYDEALKLNPNEYLIQSNRATVLANIGDLDAALDGFRQTIRLAPYFLEAHLSAASILIHLQKYREAEKELAQVFKLDPNHAQARELLRKIPNPQTVSSETETPSSPSHVQDEPSHSKP